MRKAKNRPVGVDGTKVGVLCIRQDSVVDELSTNNSVFAGLIGGIIGLIRYN